MIKHSLGTLGIFCLLSFKSHCQVVFKKKPTLFKELSLVNVTVQSSISYSFLVLPKVLFQICWEFVTLFSS